MRCILTLCAQLMQYRDAFLDLSEEPMSKLSPFLPFCRWENRGSEWGRDAPIASRGLAASRQKGFARVMELARCRAGTQTQVGPASVPSITGPPRTPRNRSWTGARLGGAGPTISSPQFLVPWRKDHLHDARHFLHLCLLVSPVPGAPLLQTECLWPPKTHRSRPNPRCDGSRRRGLWVERHEWN